MILVIADDFSGAAEIAGTAHQFGLTAEVQTDQLQPSDCEVVVVDANTRSLPASQAADVMRRLAPAIERARPRWWFKKIDSLLRGEVLAELNALSSALARQSRLSQPPWLLINANPRKARVVRDGRLLIDGQPIHRTLLAQDPEHPRHSDSLNDLLGAEPGQLQWIHHADEKIDTKSDANIVVANVDSAEELSAYAAFKHRGWFLAGAAEFFEALLAAEVRRRRPDRMERLVLHPDTIIVRGTAVRHDDELQQRESFRITEAMTDTRDLTTQVCRQLGEQGFAVIRSDRAAAATSDNPSSDLVASENGSPGKFTPAASSPSSAQQLHEQLIELVTSIDAHCKPQHLWMEGGRTASAVVRALGWERLRVIANYGDGVVGLQATDSQAPELVVKPGSYRWPIDSAWKTSPATAEVKP